MLAALHTAEEKNSTLTDQMAALRLNLAESEGKKAAAVETELDDLRQDLKEAKYEISSLQAKYSAQTKHFNEVECLLEEATEKRQQMVAEVKQLKRELQETKAEKEKLTMDAREAQKEMQEKAGMFLSLWLSSSTLCGRRAAIPYADCLLLIRTPANKTKIQRFGTI